MKTFKKILSILLCALMAVAMALNYQIFIFENSFAPSGINGIATMIQYKLGISVGYMSLFINIPLCILAFIFLKKEFALKTTVFNMVFSASLLLLRYKVIDLSAIAYHTESGTSTILAPVAAGAINGIIYGIVILNNGSTGGTDIIAELIRKKYPDMNFLRVLFCLNACVALLSFFIYGYSFEPVILCILYISLSTKIGEAIQRGTTEQVQFEIITKHYEEVSQDIIKNLKHSATVVSAQGMYSGEETKMVFCIIQKHQVVEMQKIVDKYPGTFAFSSTVTQTLGNFKHVRRAKPQMSEKPSLQGGHNEKA